MNSSTQAKTQDVKSSTQNGSVGNDGKVKTGAQTGNDQGSSKDAVKK